MRIVTLLPSATEIVCALGLRSQLVGVSHECDFPAGVAALPRVTKTRIDYHLASAEIDRQVRNELESQQALYSLDADLLESLAPDLIVTQSLCDVCAVADEEVRAFTSTRDTPANIVNIEPYTLQDVLACVRAIGEAAEVPQAAADLAGNMKARFDAVRVRSATLLRAGTPRRTVFLEWIDPPFRGGHWNPELVRMAGGYDCLGVAGRASTTTSLHEIAQADPDMLFIACCGFSMERSLDEVAAVLDTSGWCELRAVEQNQVFVADGNAYFSRPGPRLADSAEIIAHALYPDVHPPGPVTARSPIANRSLTAL
ncbi:MAG: cobalamin-binding protein [Gammaproteobacteria bacterium]|nr:cobalamin-binding protein [Gammaproteobacteria bacterium]